MSTMNLDVLDSHNAAYSDSDYLGRIVWSSVNSTEIPIQHDHVKNVLDRVGLDEYTPKLRAASDRFRKRSTACKGRYDLEDGTTVSIDVRDVSSTPTEIVRRVVAEHRDAGNQRLSHGQTWDLRFNIEFSKLDMYPIHAGADGAIRSRDRLADPMPGDDLIAGLRADYEAHRNAIDPDDLRTMIGRVLDGNKAVCVRPTGGVYLVPRLHCATVEALGRAAADLPGMFVHSAVLPNEPGHAGMVADAVTNEAVAAADALIEELRAGMTDPIGKRRMATLTGEHRDLKEKLELFKGMLRDEMSAATGRVEMLDGLLASVLNQSVMVA